MKLKQLFYKDIERDIKGVIKIGQDDEANVYQELEEYVVTRELSRHFSTFFDAYKKSINSYTDKMGVWITGFFGSGKSHFLKILSYILENREVQGKKAVSFFDDKITDPMVLADMQKAGSISSDVILFNIDSKSDSDSSSDKESILRVFNKVFNEMQGFCGSLPWLADLERRLKLEGTFEAFQESFEKHAGNSWVNSREDIYFEEENLVQALTETTKMSEEAARKWFENAREDYSLSVEKLANQIKEYIESKETEHHVIFLVDEMGQYIGDNSGLLLNLQTVVEDLGTYCGGKAWVVVTSQQEIDTITRVKGEDFSKILGRFNTRLSLSSANVDEVIKRRILFKNDVGRDTLKLLYNDKEAILKNLISFTSDTPEMKKYQTTDDFIAIYPFIPYQFKLLQAVFTAVRQHGASGKHLAEGERSLLSAFQEAALQYTDQEIGVLVPFSAFYDTIETFLDHNIRTVFINAEDNQRLNDHDLEVLKVLFMIKWVKEMPSNLENITTLMVSHIDDDVIERKKEIEASLERLLGETLIQKNGNEYLFLTHEEQDVNREIQNMPVDLGEVIKNIGEVVLNDIYSEKKYRYNQRYHFDFNKSIDDRHLTPPNRYDIGVKIITSYHESGLGDVDSDLKMMSSREDCLIVRLHDTTAIKEMEEAYKIQTYLTQQGGTSATSEIEEIKVRKGRELSERQKRVRDLLIETLKDADLYVSSQKLTLQTKNPVERINEGLRVLIESIYHKLGYVDKFVEGNNDLVSIAHETEIQGELNLDDQGPNKLALQEIMDHIEDASARNMTITMKSLLDRYSKAPYGWLADDIRGLVLRLFRAQEIKLQKSGENISTSDNDLVHYTVKKEYVDRLTIKKREKVPSELVQTARQLIKDLFNVSMLPGDEDGIMERFKDLAQTEVYELEKLMVEYKNAAYPGKKVLEQDTSLFKELLQVKDTLTFYKKLSEFEDALLEYEDQVSSVKNFFKNQQSYFDQALRALHIYDKNKAYVTDPDIKNLVGQIENIVQAEEPYADIPKLPGLVNEFNQKFVQLLNKEIEPINKVVENDKQKVLDELDKYSFKDELLPAINARFEDLLTRLKSCNDFIEAIAMKEESDRLKMSCYDDIERKQEELDRVPQPGGDEDPGKTEPVKKKVVKVSVAKIFHGARNIETEEDLEELLNYLRTELKKELREDTRLKLI